MRRAESSSDDIADDETVTKLYNILHRRDPESEVMIRQFSGRKISDIFTRALNSTEFDRKILQPLISGETIWGPVPRSDRFLRFASVGNRCAAGRCRFLGEAATRCRMGTILSGIAA